jgi:hypothetical protein
LTIAFAALSFALLIYSSMLMTNRILTALALLLFVFASCKKDSTTEIEGAWLFPIAKGELSLNSLSTLKNLKYHIDIPPGSVGQPAFIPVSGPGLHLSHVGPFPVQITDWLHRLDIDTLDFSGTLANFFPISIGPGTRVVMRTSRDTSSDANIAGYAPIPNAVPAGQNFTFDIKVLNKTLGDSVFFFLENFNSPAYSGVTFSNTPTQLDVTLKVLTASYVEIYTGRTYISTDTTEFSAGTDDQIGGRTNGTLSDTSTAGVITVFTDNSLPANASIQIYFMDDSRTKAIDSLFTPTAFNVERGRTDGAGNPSYVASASIVVPVTRLKLDHVKQASYIVSKFQFNTMNTPGLYVSANKYPKLAIQLTGDLKLNIRF